MGNHSSLMHAVAMVTRAERAKQLKWLFLYCFGPFFFNEKCSHQMLVYFGKMITKQVNKPEIDKL